MDTTCHKGSVTPVPYCSVQFTDSSLQTNVSMCNQVVHHDALAWGNDPLFFRPERWLDAGNSLSSNDLLSFGSGHRQCIGKNIAMISIVKVLTTIWRRYKLEAVESDENLVVESVGIGEKKGPLLVRARLSSSF